MSATYLVSDLAEDIIIFMMLSTPSTITTGSLGTLSVVTSIKIYGSAVALVQVLVLAALTLL